MALNVLIRLTKIACAWAMLNALIIVRTCHGGNASGFCTTKTCGTTGNGSVDIRYPFILQDDALDGSCYTDYPQLEFKCVAQMLYVNFTANSSLSNDMYEVTKIDYWNQTISVVPSVSEAICRPFDATRFGGLNITNTTTLLLDCPSEVTSYCQVPVLANNITDVCGSAGSGVLEPVGQRWVCPMDLNSFTDKNFSTCHLFMQNALDSSNSTLNSTALNSNLSSTTLELQFEGNKTLSYISGPSPAPVPLPNVVVYHNNNLSKKKKLSIILGVIFGSWLAIVIFLLCTVCWCTRRAPPNLSLTRNRFTQLNMEKMKEHKNQPTTLYTLRELEKATKNFSHDFKLGSGGFGTVFKGTLDNGMKVAIKKTNHMDMKGSEQYMNEVYLLSQVNHRNLVRLHGCCLEVEVPMLVYEYMPNGDLFQHLQSDQLRMQLTWAKRLQIAIETAEALRYLHSAAYPPIYHRDVKTSNILLDDKFNVKVADFGIARLVRPNATHVSTLAQGTIGYLDPDYFQNFQLTDKSDVYSFGMVLLELITSLKPIDMERGEKDVNLKTMALPFIQKGDVEAIADSRLFNENASESYEILVEMQRVAELASKCLADHRFQRPSMKEVVAQLIAIKGIDNIGKADEVNNINSGEMDIVPVLLNP